MRLSPFAFCAIGLLANGCRSRTRAPDDTGIDPNFRIPVVHPPGTTIPGGREIDVPLSWIYVSDDPSPTGSAPNAIVGAQLPCGFHAVYGTVTPPESPLRVRIHASFDGPGEPASAECPERPVSVQIVSLQRLRLGAFTVTDASPHAASDPPVPTVSMRVVPDDATTPSAMMRQVRRCEPGHDASCTAGGVCASVAGRAAGVCVPPIDPYLVSRRSCPDARADVALEHAAMTAPATPHGPGVRACLPSCDDTHPCDASFECVLVDAHRVCLPHA
jgi:hypothetical protein